MLLAKYTFSTIRYRLFEMSNILTVYTSNINADFPGDCVDHMTVEDRIKLAAQLEEINKKLDTFRAAMFDLQKA